MAGGSSSPASPPQAAASMEEMEEYQNWKKNAAVLYDLVISHPLEWPSLTVQWLPSESSTRSHRLVVGTHTTDEAPNHLMLLDATLPLPPRLAAASGGAVPTPSVSVSRVAPHRGEVNRARCMPQRPYTVATKTCIDEVHVYHLGDGNGSGKSGADVVLKGHAAEGYGLAWSPMKEGLLLSGSYDNKICLWDLAAWSGVSVLDAQQVFEVMPPLAPCCPLLFSFWCYS
jgi:histone-binding protein RBBP4